MTNVVRIYTVPENEEVLLLSNDADCIETAIDAAKAMESVKAVESEALSAAPLVGTENINHFGQNQGMFRYRLSTHQLFSFDAFVSLLVAAIRESLKTRNLNSSVVLNS